MGSDQAIVPNVSSALAHPFANMTWLQLAAVTVFVLIVAAGWRQVVLMIGEAL